MSDKDIEMKDKTVKEEEKKEKTKEELLNEYITQKLSEVENLPIDQIKQKIKSVEARTQYYKGEINKMKVDIRKFNARIKENKSKLLIRTGLPHLVSTVSEIFDLEPQQQEEEGSGLKQNELSKNITKDRRISTVRVC